MSADGHPPAITLTVVGCAGSYAGPDSAASCYLLQAPFEGRTYSLVIDLGSGAFGPLQRHLAPAEIDAVALSHLHPDHCLDLTGLHVVRKYGDPAGPPAVPLPVLGPRGTAERMAAAAGLAAETGMNAEFGFRDWPAGPLTLGPFTLTTTRVDHPVECFAIRVEHEGVSLTYSGDTGPTDALVRLASGTDAFLCEASFVETADNPPHLHLTGAEAGDHATRAGARRLLVTHVPAWTDRAEVAAEAKRTYDGPIDLVSAGDVHVLTRG